MIDILTRTIRGRTFLFRLDPRTKFIALILIFVSLLFTRQLLLYVPWLVVALTVIIVARISPGILLRPLRYLSVLFIMTFLFHAALTPGRVFSHFWIFYFTFEGMRNGILFSTRLFLIVLFTYLFSLTSDPMDLTDGLSRLFSPLRTLRVPVDDFITIAHISLRFIPTLFTQAHRIALAQKARGLDFKVPLIRRIRYTIPLIVPIILLSIKRAHELGLALESRWYDPGRKRTSFIELRLRKLDYSVLTIVLILIGGTQLCAILNF